MKQQQQSLNPKLVGVDYMNQEPITWVRTKKHSVNEKLRPRGGNSSKRFTLALTG